MSTLNGSCFFCGIIVSQNDNYNEKDSTESFDDSKFRDNEIVSEEAVKKCISQISNYLQITKSEVTETVSDGVSTVSICIPCWNISGRLSNLCGELEVIQMKIKYFLNLLTDQLLIKDNPIKTNSNDKSFRDTFYQKCISKLANSPINPELRITPCQTPMQPGTCQNSDDFDNEPVNFAEDSDSISDAGQDSSKQLEVLPDFNCKYCPMTLSNSYNLERHMTAAHGNIKARDHHKIKPCEYCGGMISTKNLGTHQKNVHGIGGTLPGNLEIRKKKRCEKCGKLISRKNMGAHRKVCGRKGKMIEKKNLGEDAEKFETYLIKKKFKCERCNLWFGHKGNLLRHLIQNEECKGDEKNVKYNCDQIFNCPNNCGQVFTSNKNLKRHLECTCSKRKDAGAKEHSKKIEIRIVYGEETGENRNVEEQQIKEERIDV